MYNSNPYICFFSDCDSEIKENDLWDEGKEANLYNYIEKVKCDKYEEIFKKLKNVKNYIYKYEVLHFEITKIKKWDVYTLLSIDMVI